MKLLYKLSCYLYVRGGIVNYTSKALKMYIEVEKWISMSHFILDYGITRSFKIR